MATKRVNMIEEPKEASAEVSEVTLEILDNGNALIPLSWGKVEVKEPRGRHLLEMEGWMSNYPDKESLGAGLLIARCFWMCSVKGASQLKTFDAFLDSLEVSDFGRLALAAEHFRNFFESLSEPTSN